MKLRFTPQAIDDLTSISDYIRARNPDASQRVLAAILEALQMLTEFPEMGRPQTVEGVRKLVTRKYVYLVYYTIGQGAGEIAILAIQHPARARDYSDA